MRKPLVMRRKRRTAARRSARVSSHTHTISILRRKKGATRAIIALRARMDITENR